MKKFMMPLITMVMLTTACKKERTCTCEISQDYYYKDNEGNFYQLPNSKTNTYKLTTVESNSRKGAKAYCRDRSWKDYYANGSTMIDYKTTNCKLK